MKDDGYAEAQALEVREKGKSLVFPFPAWFLQRWRKKWTTPTAFVLFSFTSRSMVVFVCMTEVGACMTEGMMMDGCRKGK